MSAVTERGGMVYVQAEAAGTREVLAEIDELLRSLGASKAGLLTARVLLPEAQIAEHEAAWSAWLGALRGPLRVRKFGGRLVDIAVTGLRMRASPSRSPHVQGRPAQG